MTTPRELQSWDPATGLSGIWWSPNPEHLDIRLRGTLSVVKDRPRLEFESPREGQDYAKIAHAGVVHGELDSGEPVTLWDFTDNPLVTVSDEDGWANEVFRYRKAVDYALIGAHLPRYADAKFTFSVAQFANLGRWSLIETPIRRDLPPADLPQHAPAVLDIEHPQESGVRYVVEVRIEHPGRVEEDAGGAHAIYEHNEELARVVFECTPAAPAALHSRLVREMQWLVAVCCQSSTPLTGEWLAITDPGDLLPLRRHEGWPDDLREPVTNRDIAMPAESFPICDLLPAWWRALDSLYPAPQVLAMYHLYPRGLLEQSATSAIAALENFHAIVGPTKELLDADYLENCLSELRSRFAGNEFARFRGFVRSAAKGNRPVLCKKLTELVERAGVDRVAQLGVDQDAWAKTVVRMRNNLAHSGSHVKRPQTSGGDLRAVYRQVRALLTLLVLGELGADQTSLDRAAEVLEVHMRFRDG